MKKIIIGAIFMLAMCGFVSAQTAREVFEKVREIKLLESDRDDVKKILKNFEMTDDEDYLQEFSNDDLNIEVSYASGNCFTGEEDDTDKWKVGEWKVTKIEISFDESVKIEDIGFDLAKLKKEKQYANVQGLWVYHDKNIGIAFEVNRDEIEEIYLFPSGSYASRLCDNNAEAKNFYASESWFEEDLKERVAIDGHSVPNVTALNLSATEIILGCVGAQNKNCKNSDAKIQVTTVATDPENDVLTFNYTVSGGEVIGKGARVVWDLTGVAPGTYTITAGVDDGCGVCGMTKTQTVVVKECADCKENKIVTLPPKQ